jgi:ABC-2 type transport system ATP-binding protein
MEDLAIKVENVSKNFKLPHEKSSSIKSTVVNFSSRKKGYEIQRALNDISFEIKKGEFFGIVGRNGSGKSTLLKLLAGIYTPTTGQVHVRGSLTPFIELGVGFNPELTGRENVYLNGALLGFNRSEMNSMYHEIVAFAELKKFMDQKLKNYSSGMQVRLAFSIAVQARSDILLIDEVLAVGDADFQRKCYSYFKQLKKDKRTAVFISHDMSAVKEFCERGILIDNGKLVKEGTALEVADSYSEMFTSAHNVTTKIIPQHSGTGEAIVAYAKSNIKDNYIIINDTVKAAKNIEELQYGIHIVAEDGNEVAVMNNRSLNLPDIKDIKEGDEIHFEWNIQNIFSDGLFSITLALADGTGAMLDHYKDSTTFRIKRKEHSTTAVLPPLSVKFKRD